MAQFFAVRATQIESLPTQLSCFQNRSFCIDRNNFIAAVVSLHCPQALQPAVHKGSRFLILSCSNVDFPQEKARKKTPAGYIWVTSPGVRATQFRNNWRLLELCKPMSHRECLNTFPSKACTLRAALQDTT